MRCHLAPRPGTMILIVVGMLSTGRASGSPDLVAGPQLFGDDYLTSTASALSSPGQSAAINTGTTNFKMDNPADGSGPSHQAWTFQWADAASVAKVEAGIKVLDYGPFVVTRPAVTLADGTIQPMGPTGELGGAVLNLKYTPVAGAPAISDLHWVQAYSGMLYGQPVSALLDTDPNNPYKAQSKISPFYDSAFAAGTLPGGGGYFEDRPFVSENEYEFNPVASLAFQVVLANDVQSVVGGVTLNTVTLYGGESWGFTFTAVDGPEPPSFLLLTLGGGAVVVFRKMRAKRRAA